MNQKSQPIYIAKVITAQPISVGALELQPSKLEARVGGHRLRLSRAEYTALFCLVQHGEHITTQSELVAFLSPNVVNVRDLMSKLRRKLAAADPRIHIVNVHGVGYRLTSEST